MGRTQIPRTAEEKRQIGDRNRRLHAAAYRYMFAVQNQTNQVPDLAQLAEWLKELGKQPRAGKLVADMIRTGWILPHFQGYKLRNQLSCESVLDGLIEAYRSGNYEICESIISLWENEKGKSTHKLGRHKT